MAEKAPATGTGRGLLAIAGAEVKEVSKFIVTTAKAVRRGGVFEPAHRSISALDPAMILLDPVIEIVVGPVLHAVTQHRSDCPWVTVMPVRGHPRRGHAGDRSGGTKKRLRGRHVTRLAETHVHQGSGTVDRPIQVTPASMDLDVGFVNVPGPANPTAPAAAKLIDQRRREFRLPLTDRLRAELDPAKEKHFGQISQAQFVTETPEHNERDDVGWIVGAVQNTAAALVELLAARAATKTPVTSSRTFRSLRHRRSFTRDALQ